MTATAEPELEEPTDPVDIPPSVDVEAVDCEEPELDEVTVEAVVVLGVELPGMVSALT